MMKLRTQVRLVYASRPRVFARAEVVPQQEANHHFQGVVALAQQGRVLHSLRNDVGSQSVQPTDRRLNMCSGIDAEACPAVFSAALAEHARRA